MRRRHFILSLALVAFASSGTAEARRAKISPLTAEGLPNVQSESALVVDLESRSLLFKKNADQVRAIASTGKIFVAMVVRRRGLKLEDVTKITEEDAKWARGGARTRLTVGHGFRNVDLLRAMLIASDNRAPSALGRAVGLSPEQLIEAMNDLAKELGLSGTSFSDCSGLNGNKSTAQDMLRALEASMADPVLAEIMTTESIVVRSIAKRPRAIHYRNTNRPLHSASHEVLGGKTGFTTAAGYCLLISAKINGRRIGMIFLGSKGKLTRFGDFKRVSDWMKSGAHTAQR